MLNLRRLRLLIALEEESSLAQVASTLRYTPSAVSQQLQVLEQEAGVQLIVRGARGSALTPAGAQLARLGRSLLAQAEAALVATQEAAAMRGGLIRLSTFPSAGATIIPAALAALQQLHPDLEIRLVEREPLESPALVASREVDLALSFTYSCLPRLDLPDTVVATRLRDERMLLAVPATHSLARRRRRVRLSDVDLGWVDNRDWGPALRLLAYLAAKEGIEARPVLESDDYQIILGLVEAGLGAALVPESATLNKRKVGLLELSEQPFRQVIALTSGEPSGSLADLISLLRRDPARR